MKKIIKEVILCGLIGGLSVILTIVLGAFYKANDHVIIINVLVWTGVVLLSYVLLIFLPFWGKKRTRYVDLLAFASGYGGIILACLFCAKSIDEYNFLTTISFLGELLAIAELVMSANRNVQSRINDKSLPQHVIKMIEKKPIDIQTNLARVVSSNEEGNWFSVSDISLYLNSTRYYANKIISTGVEVGIIVSNPEKKGQYKVFVNHQTN